jgi:hypothetical protein
LEYLNGEALPSRDADAALRAAAKSTRRCLLWVKSGHGVIKLRCPLYPPIADIRQPALDVRFGVADSIDRRNTF